MDEACSSGAGAGPPPSKRLRLSRNRHIGTGGSGIGRSIRKTPLESLDLPDILDHPHSEQQQARAAVAAWPPGKDQQCISDVRSLENSLSNQGVQEAASTFCRESLGEDSHIGDDNDETSFSRLNDGEPGLSEKVVASGEKLAAECRSDSSKGREPAVAIVPSRCRPVDIENEEEEGGELRMAEADDDIVGGRGGGGGCTRVQQQEGSFELENAETFRPPFTNSNMAISREDQPEVTVNDVHGSGTPLADRELMLCSSSCRPVVNNVADGNAAASSVREVLPVERDMSCLELVHQIVRDLELVHQVVREEEHLPFAPESLRGCSTGDPIERILGSPREFHVSSGADIPSLLRTDEVPDADESFPRSQHQQVESGVNSAQTELASEGRLPFGSHDLLHESPAGAGLTSSEENRTADDVAASILMRTGNLVETNEIHSADSQQMISDDQVAIRPVSVHTSSPSEGSGFPALNQQTVGSRVEIVESTEQDLTASDVVNILARTGRIVRAIEAYSRSPDHHTREDQVDTGVTAMNLESEVLIASRPHQPMVEHTGEVLEASREVTAEDVANIYVQAGAIAQAANNWFALSESARHRAIENINTNANWGSLVQEDAHREPGRSGENTTIDDKRLDEVADHSRIQTQETNVPDSLSCPICMEPWTNTGDHRICSLACGHLFGKSCIKRWIKQGGRRMGKCPHCNKRAKVEDLRNIYVPHIAVSDGQGYEMAQEVKRLNSENEKLKRMNAELQLEMARLQLETDRLRHIQATAAGAGILQKVEHNRSEDPANARKRQSQPSLQTFFGRNDRRRSRRNPDEHWLDGRNSKVHLSNGGYRSSSSLACIGNRGLGENFNLQNEIHLLGAKVFDMDDHSQMALVSYKASNHGSTFGLTRISLATLSEIQYVSLPPGLGAIRDVRFSPSGVGTPGKLALVASLGKRLSLLSLESNNIVLDYPLQSAPWSCAWDSGVSNQVYAGLQNGSLLIFDLRQTSSPMASFPGSSTRPVYTLQAVQGLQRKGLLSASSSGAYFWDMGTTASFTEIQRPLCISDAHREKLCVSLAYAPCLRTAVASFRPSPLAQTEASTSAPGLSQAETTSQLCGTSRRSVEPTSSTTQHTTSQDNPSHFVFRSRFEDSSSLESTHEGKNSRREWRWEAGNGMMVGHKSVSVMPRSAIIVEAMSEIGLRASFAYGDEGTNAVWLWDMNTLNVTQTLVPHQSPVLDVKYVNIGERILMGCISEKTFQLYQRPPSTL